MAGETTGDGRPVLLLALGPRLPERVVEYADQLADQRRDVVLVVVDDQRRPGPGVDSRVRVRPLLPSGRGGPLASLERALGGPPDGGRRSPLHRVAALGYGQFRAWLLARYALRTLPWHEFGPPAAIVAGDLDSVTLGARLARRHPAVIATTALDPELLTGR
ncbi:hypothetical protein [Plantactinospora sonchi]|uniref:Uncharacterized protein n=1 Tax=Plantactinospora sonchi TaxID=1544735 RepID=A0ABU7RRG2_9ACTN